jgi:hypothetical protein
LAVAVELTPGPTTTPSAGLNVSTTWATGKGSIGGVAPGSAWTNNVALAAGAASVSLVVAPGAVLAASVAWAPGSASITGGTAPGALLALATAWQPGGAQGIAPGAAWSVSAVWVGGAGSVPGTGDSTFSSNSLLLPFDGTVGSNAAPLDRSNNALTLTASSVFAISDTQFKYGQAGFFNGSARVVVPATSLLSFPGDMELQMWFYMLSKTNINFATLFELGTLEDGIMIRHGGNPGVWINNQRHALDQVEGLALNAWHHLAIARINSVVGIYLNGIQVASPTFSGTINSTAAQTFIGDSTHADNRFFNGYIDDLRIKKGVSTITGNFTPTGPHPTS